MNERTGLIFWQTRWQRSRALQNLIKHAFLSFRAREARHGIQYYQTVPGFRVKPGMTIRGVTQRSQVVKAEVNRFFEGET